MGTEVRQIDLSDPSTYSKGEVILVTDKYGWPFEFFYSMGARAPDGKIYFNSTNTSSTLNVIHHPNKKVQLAKSNHMIFQFYLIELW